MSKRPQWFDKTPVHDSSTVALKSAAKAIRYDAKLLRKSGNRAGAEAATYCAGALERVAAGATWTDAFSFPAEAQ
jgi:hypothetical protein